MNRKQKPILAVGRR